MKSAPRVTKTLLCFGIIVFLAACASGPQVTTTQAVSESAQTPYKKVLVIALLSSFDSRRYLEKEVVNQLSERGIDAVASTKMMDTRTPMIRETFVAMVDEIGADSVVVTQIVSLDSAATVKDMRPESTHILRPTYYYNVYSYELAEYVAPQGVQFDHSLVLATQVLDVAARDTIWAIESKTEIVQAVEQEVSYSVYVNEAKGIVDQMAKDRLIGR